MAGSPQYDLARLNAKITFLRDEVDRERFACLLESDNGQVSVLTKGLEDLTVRIKAYAACRRTRHWYQIWKPRCREK